MEDVVMRKMWNALKGWLAAERSELHRREAKAMHALGTAVGPKMERTVDRIGTFGLLALGLVAAVAVFIAPYVKS
jgi:hypothetical protein